MMTLMIYVIIPGVIIATLIFLIYLSRYSLKSYLKSCRQKAGSSGRNTGMFFSLVHMIVLAAAIVTVLVFFMGYIRSCSVGWS